MGLDCAKCNGKCCKVNDIMFFDFEYAKFKDKMPKEIQAKLKHFGSKVFIMPKPCPFFKKNQCSIYADRPLLCRSYPYALFNNAFGYTEECTQHAQLDKETELNCLMIVIKIIMVQEELFPQLSQQQQHLLENYITDAEQKGKRDPDASNFWQVLPAEAFGMLLELQRSLHMDKDDIQLKEMIKTLKQ